MTETAEPPKITPRRPLMVLLDALSKRWVLRVLWELREGPLTFRALRTAADNMSPSVLNGRLSELRELGVVENTESGYQLTPSGRELGVVLLSLNDWAALHL